MSVSLASPFVDNASLAAELKVLIPEGVAPPSHIPTDVFCQALTAFLSMRKVDMRAISEQVGIGRTTLYRKVGNREQLLGEILDYIVRQSFAEKVRMTTHLSGAARPLAIMYQFLFDVKNHDALRRFLAEEPETAMRILTTKHGQVQALVIRVVTRLLTQAIARKHFQSNIAVDTLAYIVIRIGESFVYGNVIADIEPDLEIAMRVMGELLGVDSTDQEVVIAAVNDSLLPEATA